jgi:Short C-terminal domain/Phospholipase_D-nuclease N-terminal
MTARHERGRRKTAPGQEADMDWSFGDVLWTMLVFFFWMMAIWIFIAIFGDIFRRRDLSGVAKAGWIFLLFVLPFLGALIYTIARPKMTEQDREEIERGAEMQRRLQGYSSAEEIEKLARLRDSGEVTPEEYETLKRRALVEI